MSSLSGRGGTGAGGTSVKPTESQKKHTLQQLWLCGVFSVFFFPFTFPADSEECEGAAWFSSQTSRYRTLLCVLDTFMIHRGPRGEIKTKKYSKYALFCCSCWKLCCPICISFPSDTLPTEWCISKPWQQVEWTQTHASTSLLLIQPCVRECQLCLQLLEIFRWTEARTSIIIFAFMP